MPRKISQLFAILLASALMAPATAFAGFVSGEQLLDICKADGQGSGNPLKSAECQGFVIGVADTFDCVEKLHGFTWDSTAKVAQAQLVKVVVDWLDKHPNALAYEADGLVGAALSESFPCH